ncbi:hypothetical protein [Streptomyces sp. NPDC056549]|uniref:hypothetical protein n=1 Tax=Streptomyces sp. NPDC056549 TaxID=3345864 RepID=UPI0036A294EF
MKIVTQVKPLPEAEQAAALRSTLRMVNEAANWVSGAAFERGVPREYQLRKHTYAVLSVQLHLLDLLDPDITRTRWPQT